MIRPAPILILAAGLALAAAPGVALAGDAPHQAHKAAKAGKAPAAKVSPTVGGINTPSTDFSQIERADEESRGPNGPTFRPTMGAGGVGLGGSF